MPDPVIYHIDANFLLNYLIPDNDDFHQAVRTKLERHNWSNDLYRVSKYALGESFKRVLNFGYNGTITWDFVTRKMEHIKRLVTDGRMDFFDFDQAYEEWNQHLKELMKIDDSFVQKADRLILAFFCADADAKRFYTTDSKIIKSRKINDYMSKLEKKIVGI